MDTFDNRNVRVLVFDDKVETTTFDCVYVGDSTAHTLFVSGLLALNRVGYRGRIVIVACGLEPTAAHAAGISIDLRRIARLTPERFSEDCRHPKDYVSEEDRVPAASSPSPGKPPPSRVSAASSRSALSRSRFPRQPRRRESVRKRIGLGPATREATRHPLRCP